ncbi:MAG TPA: 2Fe-2S iron-sulfur cluster-binding protein, partial [Candidatus Lustribacter sp.]|nr:2Fe-2S iron-sulfur cluster-binding protein [Candidatus Lustribacter sp.]
MTTVTINVNGQDHDVAGEAMLVHALREQIGTLSVKVGCDDATCGTCMVIADGRLVKACNRPASAFAGQRVVTTEGLSDREKAVYTHAYGETGAVQCGFCIPAMVMASKALLDKSPEPTRADIVKALRTDICRCTGYRQIVDAVLLAGELLSTDAAPVRSTARMRISDKAHRPDADEKVLGTGKFADDIRLPGMVFAKALRSPTPRGLLTGLNLETARAHPDCLAILTAEDVPENKIGHIVNDWDVMIRVGDCTRYVGDALALVASADESRLDEILALIEVDYEPLPPVTSPQRALSPDAPLIHPRGNVLDIEHVKLGNPDHAIRDSAHVVTRKFKTPWQEHAFMEPECAVAEPDGDGVRMYTSGQSVYDEQREIARMLALPRERVRSMS